jgi:osmotically-inducible protein OsmY
VHQALPAAVNSKPGKCGVTVCDGIVTISGEPRSEQAAHALLDAARHVQGVVAVRDRFS